MIDLSEIFFIVPLIVVGAGILISLVIVMYSKQSEEILPWFSIIIFTIAAIYSLTSIHEPREVVFYNM